MLMTLLSVTNAAGSLLYYTSAYALTGIAAFSVILYVCKDSENEDITNFHGLNQPLISSILTASLVYGWYPNFFAGFFCKNGFIQTIQAGYIALVIVAVVN
jgi:NADH-quinone oxidoreductase subunit N